MSKKTREMTKSRTKIVIWRKKMVCKSISCNQILYVFVMKLCQSYQVSKKKTREMAESLTKKMRAQIWY
jgi:hypothetical protein